MSSFIVTRQPLIPDDVKLAQLLSVVVRWLEQWLNVAAVVDVGDFADNWRFNLDHLQMADVILLARHELTVVGNRATRVPSVQIRRASRFGAKALGSGTDVSTMVIEAVHVIDGIVDVKMEEQFREQFRTWFAKKSVFANKVRTRPAKQKKTV